MAVAGLPTTGVAAAAVAGASPAAESGPVTITTLNPTIRLYPAKALGRMGDIRFGTAEIGTMMPFLGAGEITWTVSVPEAGRYDLALRSEEHTSELQSLMRISYAVFCLKKKKHIYHNKRDTSTSLIRRGHHM